MMKGGLMPGEGFKALVYSLNTTVMQDLIGWFMGFTNTEGDKDE